MSILSFVFFICLDVVVVIGGIRVLGLAIRALNGLFDKIEDKIG